MKNKSIRTKIIAGFTIVIAISAAAQIIFNLFLVRPYFQFTNTKAVEKSFYELKENYSGSEDSLDALASKIQNSHNIRIIVLNSSEILYTTGFSSRQDFAENLPDSNAQKPPEQPRGDLNGKRENEIIPDFSEFTYEPEVKSITDPENKSAGEIKLTGKFDYESEPVYVVMSIPLESINSGAAVFTQASFAISGAALIIAIIIALLISKSLTKPIVSIEQVAKNLSELDFSKLADENVSTRELANLAKSINTMSKKLESSVEELRLANSKLKKDIDYKEKIEQMRRQFIANVSHEMKTPLGLLQLYCENLRNNINGIDKEYYCNVIIEETQTLSDMVSSMLDISSIESGLSKMSFYELNISDLCAQRANKFAAALSDADFSISIEENLLVNGDKKHLAQAMNNYIQNAINHTEAGKRIEISLKKHGESARFTVKNEGRQIADDDFEHLWDAFYKSDKARTRSEKMSAGLGLYIVKTVVEKHGGTYGAKNDGNFVEFFFEIPLKS